MYDVFQEASMLAIRLEKELEERIAELAAARGGNKSTVVREAVLRYLEDQEDIALARRVKKSGTRGKSIAEVRKALGLDR
jgi:RHH-type rel operon transcriptional repressor/antitoxin RelB